MVRLRHNGWNVSPTCLGRWGREGWQLLWIRVVGKGKRAIGKIGKKQELRKAEIVTPKLQQCPAARCSDGPRQNCRGRAAALSACLPLAAAVKVAFGRFFSSLVEPCKSRSTGKRCLLPLVGLLPWHPCASSHPTAQTAPVFSSLSKSLCWGFQCKLKL